MNNEDYIDLDEVILAAKLQLCLQEVANFEEYDLKHKIFLAARKVKRWNASIRVSLDFMSIVLNVPLERISEWYDDRSLEVYPETRIAKRIIRKKTFIPLHYKESLLQPSTFPQIKR